MKFLASIAPNVMPLSYTQLLCPCLCPCPCACACPSPCPRVCDSTRCATPRVCESNPASITCTCLCVHCHPSRHLSLRGHAFTCVFAMSRTQQHKLGHTSKGSTDWTLGWA